MKAVCGQLDAGRGDPPPLAGLRARQSTVCGRRHGKEPQGLAKEVRVTDPGRHGYSALAVGGDFERVTDLTHPFVAQPSDAVDQDCE